MYFTDQIMKNDTCDTCSTNEGEEHIRFCWGNPRERKDLEDLGMDGSTILNSNCRKWIWDMDCFVLAQDRDRRDAVVNVAMDHPVS